MMRNSLHILCLFLLFGFQSKAAFSYSSKLPIIQQNGYYNILLSPEILALSNSIDGSDLRIKDSKGKEVPYIFRKENPCEEATSFQHYPLAQNEFIKSDSAVRIIVDNRKKEEIEQFCIIIQTADIQQYVSIRGSEDGKNWFVVKQKLPLGIGSPNDNISEVFPIDFPRGNYRYYEIRLRNCQNDPVRVLNVGKYKYNNILGKYTEITLDHFVQTDSVNKKSYIRFPALTSGYVIDKIGLEIESSGNYFRSANLIKGHNSYYFNLSSKGVHIFSVEHFVFDKQAFFEIENNDNAPVKISRIRAFTLNCYLTAQLEKGEQYILYFGDKQLAAPQYDLVHFEKEIPLNLPLIKVGNSGNIQKQATPPPPEERKPSFFETPLFMWVVIIVVGILLLLMCFQIIKKAKT